MRGDSGFIHDVPPPRSAKQMSVAQLPENRQAAAMDEADRATAEYPQIVVESCGLHVCCVGGAWQVWLNAPDATVTGWCISSEQTRADAVRVAVRILESVVDVLQKPTPADVALLASTIDSPKLPMCGGLVDQPTDEDLDRLGSDFQ